MALSDNQVSDRLHAALQALGSEDADTGRGQTALGAAKRALTLLSLGLLIAAEKDSDEIECIIKPEDKP